MLAVSGQSGQTLRTAVVGPDSAVRPRLAFAMVGQEDLSRGGHGAHNGHDAPVGRSIGGGAGIRNLIEPLADFRSGDQQRTEMIHGPNGNRGGVAAK